VRERVLRQSGNLIVQQGIKESVSVFSPSASRRRIMLPFICALPTVESSGGCAYAFQLDAEIALLFVSEKKTAFRSLALRSSIGSNQSIQSIHAPKTLGFHLLFLLPSLLFIANVGAQGNQNVIEVPDGLSLLLKAKGEGVQVYGCVNGSWILQAPAADLLDDQRRVIGRHYDGPTWRLNDGSLVEGAVVSKQVSPEATSIPWLLLKSVRGTGRLEAVQFIQRSETHGGIAPSENCSQATVVRVPYTAIYSFYGRAR
jgi:hypothetical protein